MKDKNGIPLSIGNKVIAFNPDNDTEFNGTVEGFDNHNRAEVSNDDGDIFVLESFDISLIFN